MQCARLALVKFNFGSKSLAGKEDATALKFLGAREDGRHPFHTALKWAV